MKTNFGYTTPSWVLKAREITKKETKSTQGEMPADEKARSERFAGIEERMKTALDNYYGALASQNKALIGQTTTSSSTVENEDGSHTTTLTCTKKSTGEVTSVNTREYDVSGRLPKETIVCYENGTVKSTTINTETYNDDGSTTGSTVKLDASGRITEEDSVAIDKDGKRTYGPKTEYTYNEDGSYTKTQIERDEQGTTSSTVYDVDKDGNVTLRTDDNSSKTADNANVETTNSATVYQNTLPEVKNDYTENITENDDGTTTCTRYDEKGRAVNQETYTLDADGNKIMKSEVQDLYTFDLSYGTSEIKGFDENGKPIVVEQEPYRHTQIQTRYDEQGRVIGQNTYNFDRNGSAVLQEIEEISYAEDGSKTETTYDATGRIVGQNHYTKDGVIKDSVHNTFNADGTHSQTQTIYDEQGRAIQENSYAFDKDNNTTLTQMLTNEYGSNANIPTTRNVYDAMGRIVQQTNNTFDENGNLISTEIADNTFNEDGSHTQTQTFKKSDGSIESVGVHKFNSSNQIVESSVEHYNGNNTVQYKEVSVNTYNADGTHSQMQKIYDILGKLIKQINCTFDAENNITSEEEIDA